MKHFKTVSTIFLSGLLLLGCTDDFDMEFPQREPNYGGTINLTQVALNPTEQRLRGQWYLRSMSTKDSAYNDSTFNRQRTINFSEFANQDETSPILHDYMSLYAKLTPDSMAHFATRETWNAPDPSTLRIMYTGFYAPDGVVSFEITKLEFFQLTLVDNSTGRKWNFER